MKVNIKTGLAFLTAALVFVSCSKEEVYESSVTRELSMTLDGEPWNIYYGTSNKPLFIYQSDGTYFANYSTSYRFSLPDGNYKVIATTQSDLFTPPTNLNDQVIEQDVETKQVITASDPIDYTAGTDMSIPIKTRTGMLRLCATDVKADRSYSMIKAVITTPVTGWHVGKASPVVGQPLELVRSKETAGGGVGYTDDAILIETNSVNEKVGVRIDYLDSDGNLVNSKPFADQFAILPNDTVEVSFALNNADEPVIIDYNLSISSDDWSSSTIYPSVEVNVPDGFTYVTPDDDLNAIFNSLKGDDSVDAINIFLRANANYTLDNTTVSGITKPFRIVGQAPGYGQRMATLDIQRISVSGNISEILFENLNITSGARMFYPQNQVFEIGEIAFVNCTFSNFSGAIWYSAARGDLQQIVNNVRMEGCRIINYSCGTNALWNGITTRNAPIYNWTFKDCLFHGRDFGTGNVIIKGLNKMTGDLTITVEGCTFVDTQGSAFTYFNIDGASTTSTTLNVRDNIVSGKGSTATWFGLGKCDNINASGNTRTKGYTMATYGVEEPAESGQTYEELLNQLDL